MSTADNTSTHLKTQPSDQDWPALPYIGHHVRMDAITSGHNWLPENGKLYFYYTLIRRQWELIYTAGHDHVNTLHDGWDSGIGVQPYQDETVLFRVLDCHYATYAHGVNIIGDTHLYLSLGGYATNRTRRLPKSIFHAIDTFNRCANADETDGAS